MALEEAGKAEDVAHVIIDDQDLLSGKDRIRSLFFFQDLAFCRRQFRRGAMQEQGGIRQQTLRRPDVFDDDRF